MKRFPKKPIRRRVRRRLFAVGTVLVTGLVLMMAGCSKPVKAIQQADGTQVVKVVVKGGYNPSTIEAKAGKPLKIEFYRDEDANVHSCAQDLVIPSENVNLHLPVRESQIVEIKPQAKGGEVPFQCGMSMMKGKIVFR